MQDEMLSHWPLLPDKLLGDTAGQDVGASAQPGRTSPDELFRRRMP